MAKMPRQSDLPATHSARSYVQPVFVLILVVGGLGLLLFYAAKVSDDEHEQQAQKRRVKAVAALKDNPAIQTHVHDAELVAMIADDPDAVKNAATLVFSDVDFSDERFSRVAELAHLENLGVYSCKAPEKLLVHLQSVPSIRKIFFETSHLSDEGVRLLGTLPNLRQIHFEQVMSSHQIELLKATLPNVELRIPYPESAEPRR